MDEAVEGSDRTDVGKQAELLAHGEQTLFGAHLGRGIVVKLRVTYGCKEHSIGLFAHLECLLGEGVAHLVDGMGTAEGFLVFHFMSELLGYGTHHCHALFHNLGADTIARENCNFQFHILFFY